jgi:polygalacturonase
MTFQLDGILQGSTNPKDYPRINTRWEGWRKVPIGKLENALTASYDDANTNNQPAHASLLNAGTYDEGENTIIGPFNVGGFSIVGKGMLNANGFRLGFHEGMNGKQPRPNPRPAQNSTAYSGAEAIRGRAVTFHNAQNVYVQGVSISYSPAWSMHAIFCDTVTWDSFDLIAKSPGRHGNTPRVQSGTADGNCILNGDGINPDSSSNCNIFDIYFCNGDDSVTLKSGRNGQGYIINKATKFVRTTDSSSIGSKGGFAAGSEIAGGTNNLLFQNCYVEDATLGDAIWLKPRYSRGGINEYYVFRDFQANKGVTIYHGYSSNDWNYARDPVTGLPVSCQNKNISLENINIVGGISISGTAANQGGNDEMDGARWSYTPAMNIVVKNSTVTGNNSVSNVQNLWAYNVINRNTGAIATWSTRGTNSGITPNADSPDPDWE